MDCAVAAHGGMPKISTYAVSKAALNALTKIHAYELREARIRYDINPFCTFENTAILSISCIPEMWLQPHTTLLIVAIAR